MSDQENIIKSKDKKDENIESVVTKDGKKTNVSINKDEVIASNEENLEQDQLDYDKNTDENTKEVLDDIENLLNDDEFIESLNVVDTWDGEEENNKKKPDPETEKKRHSNKFVKDDKRNSRDNKTRDKNSTDWKDKLRSDKRSEPSRRDPSKSSKDIEKDKLRTKKDAENKILAEKEKAIKKILDSDTVVPPGTESEAIEQIVEKQNTEEDSRQKRNREHRRSIDRYRQSPNSRSRRSPYRSRGSPYRRRSPSIDRLNYRHRSPISSERNRRMSPRTNYRKRSIDKFSPDRRSSERRRRNELRDRDFKTRRSRSNERRRSRSIERRRKYTRSPDRREDRWRSRSRSRSRSPSRRGRKRSPFINEIARQFSKDALLGKSAIANNPQFLNTSASTNQSPATIPPVGLPNVSFMPEMPNPGMINPSTPYMSYDPSNPTTVNYDTVLPISMQSMDFAAGSMSYNHPNTSRIVGLMGSIPGTTSSPQPVPPPTQTIYNHIRGIPGPTRLSPPLSVNMSQRTSTPDFVNEYRPHMAFNESPPREQRLKTPEPPVISDSKLFEKTSLSSLLEASVSAKESSGPLVLYPGFKPEILKNCEHALQDLPVEDPRLKMKGRFFYDPMKKEPRRAYMQISNSILLRKGANKIHWDDEEHPQSKQKSQVMTHQKICQTDEPDMDSKCIQASCEMVSIGVQVNFQDLVSNKIDEKRPIQERLDWNKRIADSFEFVQVRREHDLRDSLNSSRDRVEHWNQPSPPRIPVESRNYGTMNSTIGQSVDYVRDTFRTMDDIRELPRCIPPIEDTFRQTIPNQYERPTFQNTEFNTAIDDFEYRNINDMTLMREQDYEDVDVERSNFYARTNTLGGKLSSPYKLRARGRGLRGRGAPFGGSNY